MPGAVPRLHPCRPAGKACAAGIRPGSISAICCLQLTKKAFDSAQLICAVLPKKKAEWPMDAKGPPRRACGAAFMDEENGFSGIAG